MRNKRLITLLGSICLVLVLAALPFMAACPAPPAEEEEAPPIELKLGEFYPATHPMSTQAYEVWAQNVADATDGRVEVTVFAGGTLCGMTDAYDAVTAGVADIVMVVPSAEPDRFPLTMVMHVPLGFPNAEVSGKVAWDLYQKFPEFQAEYPGVKVLFFYSTSTYQIHTVKKPIYTKEDVEGLLLRSGGPVDSAIAEALGAVPQSMMMPDAYLALEKGVVDGHIGPFGPMEGFKLTEVLFYHTENANLHTSIFAVIMNLDKWNSLPSDIQEAIDGLSGAAAAELFGEVFDGTDTTVINYLKEEGHTFTTLSPEEKARWAEFLKDILDDWVAEQEANGLPGQEVLDEALSLSEKYSK